MKKQRISEFHHLVLYCTDPDASKVWYEALGFEYLRGYHGMHWFRLGEGEIMLHPSEQGPGAFAPVIHARVSDVEGLFHDVLEQGLKPFDHQQPGVELRQPVERPWGDIEFELKDPDNHVWAFTQSS